MGLIKNSAQRRSNWTSAAARRILEAAGKSCTVEEAVRIVVDRLCQDVRTPPTDLKAVAEKLHVNGWYSDRIPSSGELRRDGGSWQVVYAVGLRYGRRRFTIAHELG